MVWKTVEEAISEAVDALSLHIYGMGKDGDKIPMPSKVPVVDPDTASGYEPRGRFCWLMCQ